MSQLNVSDTLRVSVLWCVQSHRFVLSPATVSSNVHESEDDPKKDVAVFQSIFVNCHIKLLILMRSRRLASIVFRWRWRWCVASATLTEWSASSTASTRAPPSSLWWSDHRRPGTCASCCRTDRCLLRVSFGASLARCVHCNIQIFVRPVCSFFGKADPKRFDCKFRMLLCIVTLVWKQSCVTLLRQTLDRKISSARSGNQIKHQVCESCQSTWSSYKHGYVCLCMRLSESGTYNTVVVQCRTCDLRKCNTYYEPYNFVQNAVSRATVRGNALVRSSLPPFILWVYPHTSFLFSVWMHV